MPAKLASLGITCTISCHYIAMTSLFLWRVVVVVTIVLGQNSLYAKRSKAEVHRVSVTGQKDLVFLESDNPCKVLKKYCKSISKEIPYDHCFSQLHPLVLQQLTSLWSNVYKKMKVEDSFFVNCEPLDMEEFNSFVADGADASLSVHDNSSAIINELLLLLERAMQKDTDALYTFNRKRNEYKLSDLHKFELYRKAILMLPNNLFIVDQYGLALMYLDKEIEARILWTNAVARGLWENPLQRPVSRFVKGLNSQPWYNTNKYPFIAKLEAGYKDIKKELLYNLKHRLGLFTEETENLHIGGEWTELRLKSSGYGFTEHTKFFGETMKHIRGCGQDFVSIKFSAIRPGTHIRTHTGPSNERLRLHLTLVHDGGAKIRVGSDWHTWVEGKMIMFDDSWEHEVIHTGLTIRVVLIMDIWHPDLPEDKRVVH
jgi:aspartate beta-hydroxylase